MLPYIQLESFFQAVVTQHLAQRRIESRHPVSLKQRLLDAEGGIVDQRLQGSFRLAQGVLSVASFGYVNGENHPCGTAISQELESHDFHEYETAIFTAMPPYARHFAMTVPSLPDELKNSWDLILGSNIATVMARNSSREYP